MTPGRSCLFHTHTHGSEPSASIQAADRQSERNPATNTVTDVRRTRQKMRKKIRELGTLVKQFVEERNISVLVANETTEQELNRQITALARQKLVDEFTDFLEDKRRTAMGRGARAAFENMKSAVQVTRDELRGSQFVEPGDREMLQRLGRIDAGLLTEVSEETGDRITEQLRLGASQNESVRQLGRRVDFVLQEGEGDEVDRAKLGVEGQTIKSKGELIAHDAIQTSYEEMARKRYLQNGFRFAEFTAIIDQITSRICRRMDGEIIDLQTQPHLIPQLHPWCRSDIRPLPTMDVESVDESALPDFVIESAEATASFRPPIDLNAGVAQSII